MSKPDGGPAFSAPKECHVDHRTGEPTGLTKREWFAGMAMQGILANPSCVFKDSDLAKAVYDLADAMIAEGEKE